jgi:hypothetical protein
MEEGISECQHVCLDSDPTQYELRWIKTCTTLDATIHYFCSFLSVVRVKRYRSIQWSPRTDWVGDLGILWLLSAARASFKTRDKIWGNWVLL